MAAGPPSTACPADEACPAVVVRGARVHNLKDLDLEIPRDRLVVVTGPSGSGKSSLAFDTLYAEGQRRYVESLSTYARQFLDQLARPEVESIDGLSPAISIEQKTSSRNPRSTVGTATEIADSLRLLYARAGQPHCPGCGRTVASESPEDMAARVLSLPEGARVEVLAPVVRGRRGAYKKELESFRRRGYVRVRVDGEMHELSELPALARNQRHDLEVVVDRLRARASVKARLVESLTTALELADGLVQILVEGDEARGIEACEWHFSRDNSCPDCGISFPELAPRMFSFNSPAGACPDCKGLGVVYELSPDRLVPDPERSLRQGPIAPWTGGRMARWYERLLASLAAHLDVDPDASWSALPERARRAILFGLGDEPVRFELPRISRRGRPGRALETVTMSWDGAIAELERRDAQRESSSRSPLDRYRVERPCDACQGARLREEARSVRLGGLAIHELCARSCIEVAHFLEELVLSGTRAQIAERVLAAVRERLRFLCDVGLGYLSLDRATATLSGGEAQRIRLATQVGGGLTGVLYVLDEPSIGLHPRDNRRLLDSLTRLRDMGNSLVVVEHDEETIRSADWVIDMGPGAGVHGGELVAEGESDTLARSRASLTGDYLAGRRAIPTPARRDTPDHWLELSGCRAHNLQRVALRVPLGRLTVVTGVSGSGKSTLVNDTLYRALAARLHGALDRPGEFDALRGVEHVDRVIDVDQAPIGRSPRSNPVTYTGAFTNIRKLFASLPEARVRGYDAGRFSFNVKGGRCEACQGDGSLRVEMSFLPDLFVTCEQCQGRRYNRETLQVAYKGNSIADLLETSVEEAAELLENVPTLKRSLQALLDVGLGYIQLGQPATTLSGGEAQRVKLARELGKRATGRTLYLLDEPTTGLHFADVAKLLELLHRLVELGNTVVVVEHHLDVVKAADHVVDLGPEGGARGGTIVGEGTPEEIARTSSHTGRALARHLGAS